MIEGFGKKGVYVSDPGSGRRVATYEEFDRAYTGVVMTFEPGRTSSKGGARPSLIAAMRRRLRGSEWALAFVVLASLALVVPGIVIPIFSQIFIDQYLVQGSQSIIGPLLIGMLLTAFLRAALTWLQQRYLLRLQTKLAVGMSSTLFWHTLRLPLEFYSQRYAGEVGSRVTVNDRIAQLLSGQVATTALNVITVLFYVVIMFQYDLILTLIGIFFAALNFVALRFVSRQRIDTNQRLLMERGKLTGVSMGGLQSIESLKATGSESDFFVRWAGLQAKLVEAQQQLGIQHPARLRHPGHADGPGHSGRPRRRGAAGHVGRPNYRHAGRLPVPDGELHDAHRPDGHPRDHPAGESGRPEPRGRRASLRDGPAGAGQDRQASEIIPPGMPHELSGHLQLKNLTFGYSRLEPPLIEGFSLTLEPGSRVALIGASGSGKSTVAKLVTGLYPALGRRDTLRRAAAHARYPHGLLTSSLAMVDQDINLFEGTVTENLTLWDTTVPETRIVQAARDASIHDDIAARPGGYESKVEEAGGNFSGGQRQRLEIARALVGEPAILIFDEATSALDPTTESVIDDNLRRRGCTCLIVAHRLSTIRDCDEIIVLDRGKVVQRGTHEQMRDVEGPYARLIEAQAHQDGHAG